jgi:FtsH-binding integral membrane protein
VRKNNQQSMPQAREMEPAKNPTNGCLDKVLLVGAALLVCVIGVAAFWFADEYHINPAWVFVAWNSILIVPLFVTDFRAQLRKPSFVVYLIAWALIHGLFVATLMRWFSIAAMIPFLAIELTLGLFVADYFFDIRPEKEKQ